MKHIDLKTWEVQAILDGRKSQKRIVMKPQPPLFAEIKMFGEKSTPFYCVDGHQTEIKPQYQVGDILYARETWYKYGEDYLYKADGEDYISPCEAPGGGYPSTCRNHSGCVGCNAESQLIKWKPSIHMLKEAARIFIEIKSKKVERLQDITEEDAIKEGFECGPCLEAREVFLSYWDELEYKNDKTRFKTSEYYSKYNPWVWIYEFERTEEQKI